MNKKVIILALDNLDLNSAIKITNQVKDKLLAVKIGLELYNLLSKKEIAQISKLGVEIFLDLKLQDVPRTVYRSILALKGISFRYLTVMSLGGAEMVKQAKKALNELDPNIKLLCVTLLTSIGTSQLSKMGFSSSVEETVIALAKNSNDADGYVCSALECKLLREKFPSKLLFVPGLRMENESKDDQIRTATPSLALQNGADACILGRSLLKEDNIKNNLEKVLQSIK